MGGIVLCVHRIPRVYPTVCFVLAPELRNPQRSWSMYILLKEWDKVFLGWYGWDLPLQKT